ncbi:MAG: HlyD family secretion protein [Bacteroidales bacterium]|nr:HlyD family secretion protein [Bacteroidales bacterium]
MVLKSIITENKYVALGDTLIWLNNRKLKERIEHFQNLILQNEAYLKDISSMLDSKRISIETDLYKTAHAQYLQILSEFDIMTETSLKSYNRALTLYNNDVIPLTEKEEKEFQLNKTLDEKQVFIQQSLNEWQRLATEYKLTNKKYENEISGLCQDIENYTILAPGTGYLTNYNGIQAGSFVSPGQTIAVISPNDNMITEYLVLPKDIGYLRKGMPVMFSVDAYNHNQWGLASGKIIDISNEIYLINNQPFFKVRCCLNESYLTLKNGFKGKLKNGLTTTARFQITERTLAQLLFDKADNWLNPKIIYE